MFLIAMAQGAITPVFALPAGLGDIATGLAAPFVARRLARGEGRRGAVWFNVFGLLDLAVAPSIGFLAGLGPWRPFEVVPTTQALAQLQLALVPTVAVPVAITLHVVSLRRLRAAAPGVDGAQAARQRRAATGRGGELHRTDDPSWIARRAQEASPMDLYPLLIFLHVLGAVALFAALGIEAVVLPRLQRARTVEEARTWTGLLRGAGQLGPASMATILIAGVWMMAVRWGPEPWIVIALVGLVVMALLGAGLTRPAMRRFGAVLASGEGQLSASPGSLARPLPLSLRLRLAVGVGILGLMTVKPGAPGSLAIMAAAIIIGAGAALGQAGRGPRRGPGGDAGADARPGSAPRRWSRPGRRAAGR